MTATTPIRNSRKAFDKMPRHLQPDFVRVGGWYRIGKLLGSGGSGGYKFDSSGHIFLSFLGSVYLGKDIRTGAEVALKIGRAGHSTSRINHEYNVYKKTAGSTGIPSVRWYGKEGHFEVIVLDHLGTSLGDLVNAQQLDLTKTFFLASQMVCSLDTYRGLTELVPQLLAVKSLHNQHYIHRDIKPSNFMVRTDNSAVFLIDFGLAQLFRNPATYLHAPHSVDHSIVGTLPFMSIAGQQGHAQSCRDDLESLAYTIICSARGDLPWTNLSYDEEAVLQSKLLTTVEKLCKGLPAPFCAFVNYVRSLGFDEKPDYQYLQSILSQCVENETAQASLSSRSPLDIDGVPTIFSDRV